MIQNVSDVAAKGRANTALLSQLFPTNPVGKGDLADPADGDSPLRETFQRLCLDGIVPETADTASPAAQGWMAPNNFNRDFTGPESAPAPALGEYEASTPGAPASAWVPNPSSPGEGNGFDFNAKPPAPEGFGSEPSTSQWGSGQGHALGVKESSENISAVTLGDYLPIGRGGSRAGVVSQQAG